MRTVANNREIFSIMRYLNFITKIQRIKTSKLPFEVLLGHKTFTLPDNLEWENVEFIRPAKLEITDKFDEKVRIYTHKLIYRTCEDEVELTGIYAYLVTDLDGRRYLVGIPSRPYPTINISEVHPDSYASSTLTEVTVQWVAPRKAPRIQ